MSQPLFEPFGPGIVARTLPGAGEKVLWIHGYTMDSSTWQELWRQLPGRHHVGIDLPGHGASGPWAGYRTVADLARLLGARAIEQGIRHIVGLSFGSMVALQVAIEHPHAFASLTLGSPALLGGPQAPYTRERYRDLAEMFRRRGPGPWMTELWMRWPPDIFKGAAAHPALRRHLAQVIDGHTWRELSDGAMNRSIQQTPPQTVAELGRVTAPTLVLIGGEEMPAFKETAAIIQRAIPRCACVTLPGAGHLCMLEVPARAGALIATQFQPADAPIAIVQ
jgi:pimeloyl-ACP methyl ester carboxylesterase